MEVKSKAPKDSQLVIAMLRQHGVLRLGGQPTMLDGCLMAGVSCG